MRDFYKEYNPAFQKYWKAEKGENITIQMSHGGSSKQARSVIDGLPADVITMNQATDIDALADNGGLVPKDWATRLPNNSAPFTSATVFIVRKGNPKALKDWPDLLKDGVQVVVPNPKTSGNGRYTYLSAWGYVLKNGGDENKAKEFVGKLFKQVPVLDTGGRAATTTFMQNQIGDVLVTFENEAEMIAREFGRGGFEVVYLSVSAEAEPPVAVVDKVVEKKGSRAQAEAYLKYLWSDEGPDHRRQQLPAPAQPGDPRQVRRPLPESRLLLGGEDLRRLAQRAEDPLHRRRRIRPDLQPQLIPRRLTKSRKRERFRLFSFGLQFSHCRLSETRAPPRTRGSPAVRRPRRTPSRGGCRRCLASPAGRGRSALPGDPCRRRPPAPTTCRSRARSRSARHRLIGWDMETWLNTTAGADDGRRDLVAGTEALLDHLGVSMAVGTG